MSAKKKQKQLSIEEYIEAYCQEKRIRGRFAVYITPETHHRLKRIAQLFKSKYHSTASSLADAIISHHINAYKEILNEAYHEDMREHFEWLKEKKQYENEELETSQYDNEE